MDPLGGAGDAPEELIDLNDLVASVAALNEGAAAQAGVTLAVTPIPGRNLYWAILSPPDGSF